MTDETKPRPPRHPTPRTLFYVITTTVIAIAAANTADHWLSHLPPPQSAAPMRPEHDQSLGRPSDQAATSPGPPEPPLFPPTASFPLSPSPSGAYHSSFRDELVRSTESSSSSTQRRRERILAILDELAALLVQSGAASERRLRSLGQELSAVLDEASRSDYQLGGAEFTLTPGKAWMLPGSQHTIAFLGRPPDGNSQAIALMRHGRRVTMTVGSVRVFHQGGETCELVLREIAPDHTAATFSFSCKSSR